WICRRLQIEVDLWSVNGQPAVVRVDPAPGLAVPPRQGFARKPCRTVEAEVEDSSHAPARPRFRHSAADVKPRCAPGRTPRIADLERDEGAANRVRVGDGLAPDGIRGQLEGQALCQFSRFRTTTGMRRSVRVW